MLEGFEWRRAAGYRRYFYGDAKYDWAWVEKSTSCAWAASIPQELTSYHPTMREAREAVEKRLSFLLNKRRRLRAGASH